MAPLGESKRRTDALSRGIYLPRLMMTGYATGISPGVNVKTFRTKNGQAIQPYTGACKDFPVTKTEGDRTYKLCQILPPIPQRFEWINANNIVSKGA
jgi:hypothetical protein